MVRSPALTTVLLAVLIVASSIAAGSSVAGTPESSDDSVSTACIAGTTVADGNNVSLTLLTAPESAYARLRNASAIAAAVQRGVVTPPAETGPISAPEDEIAMNDTIVHRLDLDGSATTLFDLLASQDGPTPTERFVALLRADVGVSMTYQGPTACPPELNLTATVGLGGLRVVPDESNGSLFLVLDQGRMAMNRIGGGGPPSVDDLSREYGHHEVGISFAQSSGLVSTNTTFINDYEVTSRHLSLGTRDDGVVRLEGGRTRLVLSGETTVAPTSELTFELRPLGRPGSTRAVSATVDRNRTFRVGVDLPNATADGVYELDVEGAFFPPGLVAVGDARGARIWLDDREVPGGHLDGVPVTTTHGGFVVVRNRSGAVLGHSQYLEPGADDARFDSSAPIVENGTVVVEVYRDANDDERFDPETDEPYRVNGSVVRQSATASVEWRSQSPPVTSTPTSTAQTRESSTSSVTTEMTATEMPANPATGEPTTATGGQPGFGLAVGVIAVLIGALAGRSRR